MISYYTINLADWEDYSCNFYNHSCQQKYFHFRLFHVTLFNLNTTLSHLKCNHHFFWQLFICAIQKIHYYPVCMPTCLNRKPNGYRSLHLTIRLPVFFAEKEIHVPVEIQLRTIAMDFWASLEHTIRYKKNLPINAEVETELKECADSSREWDSKMEHLLHILT